MLYSFTSSGVLLTNEPVQFFKNLFHVGCTHSNHPHTPCSWLCLKTRLTLFNLKLFIVFLVADIADPHELNQRIEVAHKLSITIILLVLIAVDNRQTNKQTDKQEVSCSGDSNLAPL